MEITWWDQQLINWGHWLPKSSLKSESKLWLNMTIVKQSNVNYQLIFKRKKND